MTGLVGNSRCQCLRTLRVLGNKTNYFPWGWSLNDTFYYPLFLFYFFFFTRFFSGSSQNADHADGRLQTADRADHGDCADRAD